MKKLTFGSLFSGIGGIDLGLERAGMECKWQVEIDPFCRKVLAKHWPEVKKYKDIREVKGIEAVDVICGGFPCQDLSIIGRKKGITGERSGLYTEMLRIISICRPKYTIFENVSNLLRGGRGRWFAKFLYDLAEIGLDAEWHCIQAAHIGAIHSRDRIWVIAYTNKRADPKFKNLHNKSTFDFEEAPLSKGIFNAIRRKRPISKEFDCKSSIRRIVDGFPDGVDRLKAIGNAAIPQIAEILGIAILKAEEKK